MCCFSCSLLKHTHRIAIPQFAHSSVDGQFKLLSVVGLRRENCSEFLVLSLSAWHTHSFLWVESSSPERPCNRSCQILCVSGCTIVHITSGVWASRSIYVTINLIPSLSLDVFGHFSLGIQSGQSRCGFHLHPPSDSSFHSLIYHSSTFSCETPVQLLYPLNI